jgi:uncharacterized protein
MTGRCRVCLPVLIGALVMIGSARAACAQTLPKLTQPVNDFAHVIDAASAAELDRLIRALHDASKDTVVVATVDTFQPNGSIEDYAVKLFEQSGIGQRDRDNGLLILLAAKDRKVRIEVGYGLEEFITDGYAGDTIRQDMLPAFRNGKYGEGLLAGTARIIGRIAEKRNVSVTGLPAAAPTAGTDSSNEPFEFKIFIAIMVILMILRIVRGRRSGLRRRGGLPGSTWSGWHGGVGGFGGGGGFSSGGGGGFGGFGGGRSGGGGASGGW